MGSCGWLIGDRTVAQGHAHNGRHVSLSAKHVDGDPSGLPCEGGKRVHHSSLQIRAQVHTTLQRSYRVLPDVRHFLCKTKYAAQASCQIFISTQTCEHSSAGVGTPFTAWTLLSHPNPRRPHTPASLAWPLLLNPGPAPSSAWSSHPRPSPSCSRHSAQVPPPDDLESRSPPHHPACFTM